MLVGLVGLKEILVAELLVAQLAIGLGIKDPQGRAIQAIYTRKTRHSQEW